MKFNEAIRQNGGRECRRKVEDEVICKGKTLSACDFSKIMSSNEFCLHDGVSSQPAEGMVGILSTAKQLRAWSSEHIMLGRLPPASYQPPVRSPPLGF